MTKVLASLAERLEQRTESDSLRSLKVCTGTDFTSNDYLGLARCETLRERIAQDLWSMSCYANGAGGSRLLSGNTEFAEKLEQFIATYHNAESALIFNSGYDANIGLFSAIATRHDTIFYDELCHASIIDGIRLSHSTAYKFVHNDVLQLESKLKLAKGNVFIAVESLYSMDGDMAPLLELAELAQRNGASLIVDEAHATGVFGENGCGLVNELRLESQVFARVHTFGKALGVHGAAVVGPQALRNILVNFARSFIYTTALPLHSLVAIRNAYDAMLHADKKREQLSKLIAHFRQAAKKYPDLQVSDSVSPIQNLRIAGNSSARKAAESLQSQGFDVRAILSPTVPAGTERLRICLHAFNTIAEIDFLLCAFAKISAPVRPTERPGGPLRETTQQS